MTDLKSLTDTWGTDMVTIFVGAQKKKFVLHKMLVCREAPYFDKAFNGSFEEAKTQECYLPDDESSTFELFVSYIYTNRLPDDVKAVSEVVPVYEPVMKFYVLADKLLMSNAAKTASLDALIKARATSGLRLNETTITFVLARTAEDCPLRQLVFDIMSRDFLATPDFRPRLARLLSERRVIRVDHTIAYGDEEPCLHQT